MNPSTLNWAPRLARFPAQPIPAQYGLLRPITAYYGYPLHFFQHLSSPASVLRALGFGSASDFGFRVSDFRLAYSDQFGSVLNQPQMA